MKKCFKCNISKELDEFYKHPQMPDGHVNKCKECNKLDVRKNYKSKINYYRQYDKNRQRYSIDRILSHRYNNLKSRSDINYARTRKCTVTGMPYLSKKDFLVWAESTMEDFTKLYVKWAMSGFNTKLMPSIDRINNNLGYIPSNMRWITKSDNSKKGNK